MKKHHFQLKPLEHKPEQRSSSSGNQLAKRLYKHSSLTKLTPLSANHSMLAPLHTSLVPSISLKKLNKMDSSHHSMQFSQGKILLRKHQEFSFSQQTSYLKKIPAHKKFQKVDLINQKIIPDELRDSLPSQIKDQPKKFKPNRKWFGKLKQAQETQQLTPQDFIQLIQEQGGMENEFCYLQKGEHPYDLRIVQFRGANTDQYITISSRGVTYFNWEGSRFVGLEEWRRQAKLFRKLIKLQFFGKHRLHKNFTNWKKYVRKVAMKKTSEKLKNQLLVHDKFLRNALLSTREQCCRMQTQTNYCYFDATAPALPFNGFKSAQDNYLGEKFQRRLDEFQQQIKQSVTSNLNKSMINFKQENKISSGNEGKGIPLLIGDQKNLQMPYTKEATLRVQQDKFKRFLKLVELVVIHSKINMMDEATLSTARKLQGQNENFQEYLYLLKTNKNKNLAINFKGKQYIQCQLEIQQDEERAILKPSRQDLQNYIQDTVSRSVVKLIRNHHKISNDPQIQAILYDGAQQQNVQQQNFNTLKNILGSEEKQESMVNILSRALNVSYSFVEHYSLELTPLVQQYFRNQHQLQQIPNLTSQDFFTIRQWLERWRKELDQVSKLNQEHQSAVFLLNFKQLKETSIKFTHHCLNSVKDIVPKILNDSLKKQQQQLKESLRLMEMAPVGIQAFILYQNNRASIANKFDDFQQRLSQIGQLTDILKDLGGSGQTVVIRSIKGRKQLGQKLKTLKSKIQQAEMNNKVYQTYAQEQVNKMVPKVYQGITQLYKQTQNARSSPTIMVHKITQWNNQYQKLKEQLCKLKEYKTFLCIQEIQPELVQNFNTYFTIYQQLWQFRWSIQIYYEEFIGSAWRGVDPEETERRLEHFIARAEELKKNVSTINSKDNQYHIQEEDENQIQIGLQDMKYKIQPLLSAIQCLLDPSLQDREVKFIKQELEKKGKSTLAMLMNQEQTKIQTLLGQGLIDQLQFLRKIVFKSKKQYELNTKMSLVIKFWNDSLGHSCKQLFQNFNQTYYLTIAQVQQKITILNCVRQDPQIEQVQFRNRIQIQKNLMDSLRSILYEWHTHHCHLTELQPIFSNTYWKGTAEHKLFSNAESNWKKLSKQIGKDCSLRKLASQQKKHIGIFKQNNVIFEELYQFIEQFLNSKREYFPKLFFLSNQQLLPLTLNDKDYTALDRDINMIFPHIKGIELNQQRNSPVGVRNNALELLSLRPSPPKQFFQFEQGLRMIDQRVKDGVRSALLKCSNYYIQDDFVRKIWIKQNILQALIFISNVQFTKLLQSDYLLPEGDNLQQLINYQTTQIRDLQGLLKDQFGPQTLEHQKFKLMLLQLCHFRDITQRLMLLDVKSQKSFEWLKEIRSYYNGSQQAFTKYLTHSVDYGYEFMCPNENFIHTMLSQKQFVDLNSTIALGYVPIIQGKNETVKYFCEANAKNYLSISLQPGLATHFISNICQGAIGSNTFLEIRESQFATSALLSMMSTYAQEAKCMQQRKQAFYVPSFKSSNISSSFTFAFRVNTTEDIPVLQRNLTNKYRTLSVPEVSPSILLACISQTLLFNSDSQLPSRLQKCLQILNSCHGSTLIWTKQLTRILNKLSKDIISDFKQQLAELIIQQINQKIVSQAQNRYYSSVVHKIILGEDYAQALPKTKSKLDKQLSNLTNALNDVLSKKNVCLLLGPSDSSKSFIIQQILKDQSIQNIQYFLIDTIKPQNLLGNFKNGLWRQGILSAYLKKLNSEKAQLIAFEGDFTEKTLQLMLSIEQKRIFTSNGECLTLSPHWKFIFLTEMVPENITLPSDLQIIGSDCFVSIQEQLQHYLQKDIRPFFLSNQESFAAFSNYCINNFQKIMKFRIQTRFYKAQYILRCFIVTLKGLLRQLPVKGKDQLNHLPTLQRLFIWSIYWTIHSSLTKESANKFQQLFQPLKLESDRGVVLSQSRFEFENLQGAFKKVKEISLQRNGHPFLTTAHSQAILRFAQLNISNKSHLMFFGPSNSGKTSFIDHLQDHLGQQSYSFLKIRLNRDITIDQFKAVLLARTKIITNSLKIKQLVSINGKQIVLILDDINLLQSQNAIYNMLISILTLGHYFDPETNQKVQVNNISVVAAQNSLYQSTLQYSFVKLFKIIELPQLDLQKITQLYSQEIRHQEALKICQNVASLHDFALTLQPQSSPCFSKNLDIPIRILRLLKQYTGKQNMVKVWQYLSIKQYINAFPENRLFSQKMHTQISNYSNLLLNNNQQPPNPTQNSTQIIRQMQTKYPHAICYPHKHQYFGHMLYLLQNSCKNLFTINQPLCPSSKKQLVNYMCFASQAQLIYPHNVAQIQSKMENFDGKLVVYISDTQSNFYDLLEVLMSCKKSKISFMVDFQSVKSWQECINRHPYFIHYGTRFVHSESNYSLQIDYAFSQQLEYWNSILIKEGVSLSKYDQQQICKIIKKRQSFIQKSIQQQQLKNSQILRTYKTISQQIQSTKITIQTQKQILQNLSKQQQEYRRKLSHLKNNYSAQQNQSQKNARTSNITSVETRLNQIMANKRANEDASRQRLQEISHNEQILKNTQSIAKETQQWLQSIAKINQNVHSIITFLAIVEYFFTKNHTDKQKSIEKASSNLIVPFNIIFKCIFACQAYIQQHTFVLWLINHKSLILNNISQEFIDLVKKRLPSCQFIDNPKDLQELTQIDSNTAYFFVGNLRNQVNNFSVQNSPTYKDRNNNRQDQRDNTKQQKKRVNDSSKNILFWVQEKAQQKVLDKLQQKESNLLADLVSSTLMKTTKESQNMLTVPTRKGQKRGTRMSPGKATLHPGSGLRPSICRRQNRNSQTQKPKPVYQDKLMQELTLKIKNKSVKEGDLFMKSDCQLQNFLTFSLENNVFEQGSKVISSCVDKHLHSVKNITLICQQKQACTFKINTKNFDDSHIKVQENVLEQLLSDLDLGQTALISNLEKQLSNLKEKHISCKQFIIQRLIESTPKSKKEIYTKYMTVFASLRQSIQNIEMQIIQNKQKRSISHLDYFDKCMFWWHFVQQISSIFPFLRLSKRDFKETVISCIQHNPQIQIEPGKFKEPEELINFDESANCFKKNMISYILVSLTYREGLLAMCLLALKQEITKGDSHQFYIEIFKKMIKDSASTKEITESLTKYKCSEHLRSVIQTYISFSGSYYNECHNYINTLMAIEFQRQQPVFKATWRDSSKNIIVLAHRGADPYIHLSEQKKSLFVKQNSDYLKAIESMADKNYQKLVLLNFQKSDSYQKILKNLEENKTPINLVFVFTNRQFFQKCRFKDSINNNMLVQLQQINRPHNQLTTILSNIFKEVPTQLEKIVKLVFFSELNYYLQQKIKSYNSGFSTYNLQFYVSELLKCLLFEVNIKDSKNLLDIACQLLRQNQSKWLIKESKKYLRKQLDGFLKTFLGGDQLGQTFSQQPNAQLTYFMGKDSIIFFNQSNQLKNSLQCQSFILSILPSSVKKTIQKDLFYSMKQKSTLVQISSQKESGTINWSYIDNLSFQIFSKFESINYKKQADPSKSVLRTQNTLNYQKYKWIYHNIRRLKNINRNTILSQQTKNILKNVSESHILQPFRESLEKTKNNIAARIHFIQNMYLYGTLIKPLKFQYWQNPLRLITLSLYTLNKNQDLIKSSVYVKTTQQKPAKGWELGQIQLKNCRFDPVKNVLQSSDKGENRITNAYIVLGEQQKFTTSTYSLPLTFKQKQCFKLEIASKIKEDSFVWKEPLVGLLPTEHS